MFLSPWFEMLWLFAIGSSLMSFCVLFGKATGNIDWRWGRVGATVITLFLLSMLSVSILWWIAGQIP